MLATKADISYSEVEQAFEVRRIIKRIKDFYLQFIR
jgi:hypothetical protein